METGATHEREDPRVQCHRCLKLVHYDPIQRGAHPCIPTPGWKVLEDQIRDLTGERDAYMQSYQNLNENWKEAAKEVEDLRARVLDNECQISRMAEAIREHRANQARILDALGNGADEYVWVPGMSWVDAACKAIDFTRWHGQN